MVSRHQIDIRSVTIIQHTGFTNLYVGPKPGLQHTVDHRDGNVYNNRYENLQWATKKEQARSVRAVEGYVKETGLSIGVWPIMAAAAKETGAGVSHIGDVTKGKRLNAGKTQDGQNIAWRWLWI